MILQIDLESEISRRDLHKNANEKGVFQSQETKQNRH